MKRLKFCFALAVSLFALCSCSRSPSSDKKEPQASVSFNVLYRSNLHKGIVAAYTTDPDSLWSDEAWADAILKKMQAASEGYSTVLLFDSREHTPDVTQIGMQYREWENQWTIAGYWKYPTGKIQFAYGGMVGGDNFRHFRDVTPSR